MSKKTKKETAPEVQNPEEQIQQPVAQESVVDGSPANNAPAYVKELLEKGVVVLSGRSREELAEMVNNIPADVHYGAGAVGFNSEMGDFSLRLDITNN